MQHYTCAQYTTRHKRALRLRLNALGHTHAPPPPLEPRYRYASKVTLHILDGFSPKELCWARHNTYPYKPLCQGSLASL